MSLIGKVSRSARKTALFTAAILAATPVFAADHLQPEDSTFGGEDAWQHDYDSMVVAVLKDAFARDVEARVIIEPSFHAELAVGVSADEDRYAIFTLTPAVHLWGYQVLHDMENGHEAILKDGKEARDDEGIARLRALLPADWHNVKVARCDIGIDAGLGKQIVEAWQRVLIETRFSEADHPAWDKNGNFIEDVMITLDGTILHFASRDMAGKAWNPPASGAPGKLAGIADVMAEYCASHERGQLSDLTDRVRALIAEMKDPSGE